MESYRIGPRSKEKNGKGSSELNEKQTVRTHKKFLVSRPQEIEKVMRACYFYFYFSSFLQGQTEIFETGIISNFPHIMRNVLLSWKLIVKSDRNVF